MNVFVTGAAPVIRLFDDGHSVSILDNRPGLMADDLGEAGARVPIGCITDRAIVAKAISHSESVMHLAAAFRETGTPDSLYKAI